MSFSRREEVTCKVCRLGLVCFKTEFVKCFGKYPRYICSCALLMIAWSVPSVEYNYLQHISQKTWRKLVRQLVSFFNFFCRWSSFASNLLDWWLRIECSLNKSKKLLFRIYTVSLIMQTYWYKTMKEKLLLWVAKLRNGELIQKMF